MVNIRCNSFQSSSDENRYSEKVKVKFSKTKRRQSVYVEYFPCLSLGQAVLLLVIGHLIDAFPPSYPEGTARTSAFLLPFSVSVSTLD